jgi:Ca-activated chloride channel family protein
VEIPSGWEMPAVMPMTVAGTPMTATLASFSRTETMGDPFAGPAQQAAGSPDAPLRAPLLPGGPFRPAPAGPPPGAPSRSRSVGRGFTDDVLLPHPGRERAPETDLAGVRPLLVEELARLRAAEPMPERDRRRYLADLASRLRVIVQMVGDHAELAALAADLATAERADRSLDDLWRRAIELLTTLTGGSSPSPGPSGPAGEGHRAFWKRS